MSWRAPVRAAGGAEVATLHDMTRASVDALASALAESGVGADGPRPGLARTVTRRRAIRRLVASGAAAAVVAAGAGAAWAGSPDPAPHPGPDQVAEPSPSAAPLGSVTLPAEADTLWTGSLGPRLPSCGDPLPPARASSGGFTLDVAATPASGETVWGSFLPTWDGSLTYAGPSRHAYLSSGIPVVARDGVIVAVGWENERGNEAVAVHDGTIWGIQDRGGDIIELEWCNDASAPVEGNTVLAEAGGYEVAWVASAHMTSADAALAWLADEGYVVAPSVTDFRRGNADELREVHTWTPGSVDCLQQASWQAQYGADSGVEIPVQCLSDIPDGVSVDPDTGLVTAPYDRDFAGEALDVVLASEPVVAHLSQELTWEDLGWSGSPADEQDAPPSPEPPACGADASGVATIQSVGIPTTRNVTWGDVASGARVPVQVDFLQLEGDHTANASLPDGAQVWLVTEGADLDAPALAWSAHGTARFSPSVAPIDRRAGYPEVEFWIEGLTYCPGFNAGTFVAPGVTGAALIDAPVAATWDSGRRDEYDSVVVYVP